jgi:hypothetical protein
MHIVFLPSNSRDKLILNFINSYNHKNIKCLGINSLKQKLQFLWEIFKRTQINEWTDKSSSLIGRLNNVKISVIL